MLIANLCNIANKSTKKPDGTLSLMLIIKYKENEGIKSTQSC